MMFTEKELARMLATFNIVTAADPTDTEAANIHAKLSHLIGIPGTQPTKEPVRASVVTGQVSVKQPTLRGWCIVGQPEAGHCIIIAQEVLDHPSLPDRKVDNSPMRGEALRTSFLLELIVQGDKVYAQTRNTKYLLERPYTDVGYNWIEKFSDTFPDLAKLG
jgi:hypothetical protein